MQFDSYHHWCTNCSWNIGGKIGTKTAVYKLRNMVPVKLIPIQAGKGLRPMPSTARCQAPA